MTDANKAAVMVVKFSPFDNRDPPVGVHTVTSRNNKNTGNLIAKLAFACTICVASSWMLKQFVSRFAAAVVVDKLRDGVIPN